MHIHTCVYACSFWPIIDTLQICFLCPLLYVCDCIGVFTCMSIYMHSNLMPLVEAFYSFCSCTVNRVTKNRFSLISLWMCMSTYMYSDFSPTNGIFCSFCSLYLNGVVIVRFDLSNRNSPCPLYFWFLFLFIYLLPLFVLL